ncbi:MAG: flagellar biosynthetic protein FliO [Treponema sp.]|nr:flagellar biosynthetic protein FliO [Treponema sp.]
MKIYALVLCAMMAFGAGASVSAQQAVKPQATGTANAQALGNAQAVDETTLSLDAPAPAANQAAGSAQAAGPNTFAYFLRMIVVLALVVGAMYLVFSVMRRLAKPRDSGDSPIRVLGSRALGAGKSVHLLGLGSKAWLVGSSEHSISLIAEIDDKELLDGLELETTTRAASASTDFAALLGSLLSRKKGGGRGLHASAVDGPETSAHKAEGSGAFIARQRGRLDRFNGERP